MGSYQENTFNVYKDIQTRTNGALYLGVVGPVRTGKSTFIKRFMDVLVLPEIDNLNLKRQITDELPQSGNGKTITTTEPKFIPMNPASIRLMDDSEIKLRFIDCVGFMTEGALGHMEENSDRMVKTPWSKEEIPFSKAAEIGTRKVIEDHSTIGIVVTTDGSFSNIPRENYLPPEEETVRELQKIGKPFIVLLNSSNPDADETRMLAGELEEKYHTSVIPVNCLQLGKEDITYIMDRILSSFPVKIIYFSLPKWVELLDENDPVKSGTIKCVREYLQQIYSMKDLQKKIKPEGEYVEKLEIDRLHRENGEVKIDVQMKEKHYYEMLSRMTGCQISNESELIKTIKALSDGRNECEGVLDAWKEVKEEGYGVVKPQASEITVSDPELVKHGNKYGVKLKATAPSTQLIRADIEIEIAPIVGTMEQANDLIAYMKQQADEGQNAIFETNIFGKTVRQLIEDGIDTKINNITQESRGKLQNTMQKIVNESNRGIICIIL